MIDLKSWNPWHGCRKYSEGCANCYMFVLDKAHKVPGQSTEIFRTRNFSKPLERDRKGNFKVPPGYWVRVNMTSDTFLEEADPWREEMWRPKLFWGRTKTLGKGGDCCDFRIGVYRAEH